MELQPVCIRGVRSVVGDILPGNVQKIKQSIAGCDGVVMIRGLVDFALNNRWMVLGLAIMLFVWGIVSFHNLPVEAYPDVANNYVQVITQWPGRAAEEVEQQVTIPLEIQMAGISHMTHLRSTSLAGLSSLTLIFDDESINDWNREKVLERLSQVTLPTRPPPQIRAGAGPGAAR